MHQKPQLKLTAITTLQLRYRPGHKSRTHLVKGWACAGIRVDIYEGWSVSTTDVFDLSGWERYRNGNVAYCPRYNPPFFVCKREQIFADHAFSYVADRIRMIRRVGSPVPEIKAVIQKISRALATFVQIEPDTLHVRM